MMMRKMDDQQLLQAYAKDRSEAAFRELVNRHIDWVFSVALRHVPSNSIAQDVAQSVFILLAAKAPGFRPGTRVGGWLFRTTRFVADRALRAEMRRQLREQTAADMRAIDSPADNDATWQELEPHLDAAVASLTEIDQAAIRLRFFEKKPLGEIGRELGLTEEAAKKRVSRAVEKMRDFLSRRGVGTSATLLVALLASKSVQAAPASLASTIVQAVAASTAAAPVLPALATETLKAWRWARVKTLSLAALPLLILTVWMLQTPPSSQTALSPESRTANASTVAGPARAMRGADQKKAAKPAGNTVLFRVVAPEGGQGIAGARVLVNYVTGGRWTFHDDLQTALDGSCLVSLPDTELARLDLGALKDGFVQKFYTWRSDSELPLPRSYTLKLEPAVRIGGRVVGTQGSPVAGAEIAFFFHGTGDSTARENIGERLGFAANPVTAVKTDNQGYWTCALSPAGYTKFGLEVKHPRYTEGSFAIAEQKEPSASAETLLLQDLLDRKALLTLKQGIELRGVVLDDQGSPIAGAKVTRMDGLKYRQDGLKTAADGSFRLGSLPPGDETISVWAKGYAPALTNLEVSAATPPLIFRLNRGQSFTLRLVDESGIGIPEGWIALDLPVPHNGDFHTTTDASGRAQFSGIPLSITNGLVAHATAKGYFWARDFVLHAINPEPVITLKRALQVFGNVIDDDTGEPIAEFKAIPSRGERQSLLDRSETRRGQWGAYSLAFTEPSPTLRLRIEAEGYQPAMSAPLSISPPEQQLNFRLRKSGTNNVIAGGVTKSDGAPAAEVSVALLAFERLETLHRGALISGEESTVVVSGHDGEFKLKRGEQDHTIVAAHPVYGFGVLKLYKTTPPYRVLLQPWGRIEGLLVLEGKPAPNREISISSGFMRYRSVRDGLFTRYDRVFTDNHGRFTCDYVPPGDVTLQLSHGSERPYSHATQAEVRPGETTSVQIGGTGRLVIGRLIMEDGTKANWPAQLRFGALQSDAKPPAAKPPPSSTDFESRVRLLEFFETSDEWHAFEKTPGPFPVNVYEDGSFRIEDVPPGAYQLKVSITEKQLDKANLMSLNRVQAKQLAYAQKPILLPEQDQRSSDPLDVGTLILRPASR